MSTSRSDLTVEDLERTYKKLCASAPEPIEIYYNSLTATGRYSDQFSKIAEANRGPLGMPLIPMIELEDLPEGVLVLRYLGREPFVMRGFDIEVIDLRHRPDPYGELP